MNLLIFITLVFASSIIAIPHDMVVDGDLNDEWQMFKMKFNKKYDALTEISRRLIWEENLKNIQKHNIQYNLGKYSYYVGVNAFSDMSHEEFKSKYLGLKLDNDISADSIFMPPENMGSLPETVDWREKGYVTPVKDQVYILFVQNLNYIMCYRIHVDRVMLSRLYDR